VEAAPLDTLDAVLLTLTVPDRSRLPGVALYELRLPALAVLTLIVRQGRTFVPQRDTRLVAGDEVLIVTPTAAREATERRLRAVSRRGKLAYWFGERGNTEPPDQR
jgi:potassium/hydrogen antiporter